MKGVGRMSKIHTLSVSPTTVICHSAPPDCALQLKK
jgi:hypothetical protein